MTCKLCGGSGHVYTEISFGVEEIAPCPNCNKAYKAEQQRQFDRDVVKTPSWVRQAVTEILS